MNFSLIEHRSRNFYSRRSIEKFVGFLFDRFGVDKNRELNILFCDDEEIRQMNREFREKDAPTNVLSFYGYDDDILGDIAISLDTVEREAGQKEKDPYEYLLFIISHGFLHLLGYTHETMDKFDYMMELQNKIVDEFLKKERKNEESIG